MILVNWNFLKWAIFPIDFSPLKDEKNVIKLQGFVLVLKFFKNLVYS